VDEGYRKKLIRIITFLGGLYFVLEFLLPEKALELIGVRQYHDQISYGFIAVGAVAFGLGLVNLFMVHGGRILFGRRGWINSVALLLGLIVTMALTVADWRAGLRSSAKMEELSLLSDFVRKIASDAEAKTPNVPPHAERVRILLDRVDEEMVESRAMLDPAKPESKALEEALATLESTRGALTAYTPPTDLLPLTAQLGALSVARVGVLRAHYDQSVTRKLYNFFTQGLFTSLGSAMFSLLAVYIAAAAYRAFRVRTFESFLMMAAAVLVMLGQTPFGLWIYEGLPAIRLWLLEVPNSAAFRAIKIGSSVAALVMALRMWLSIESESFAETRD
jgi:hypothetical protein